MLVWAPNTDLTPNPVISFRTRTHKLTKRPPLYVFVLLTSCQEPAKVFASLYTCYSYCTEIWTRSHTVVNCRLPPLVLRLKCVWTPSRLSVYFVKRVFVVSNSTRDIAVP